MLAAPLRRPRGNLHRDRGQDHALVAVHRGRRVRPRLAYLVAVVALSACTSIPAGNADTRIRSDSDVVRTALDVMNLDPALDAAEQVLTNACLERLRLSIPLIPVYPQPRIGITGMAPFTLREARLFGFGLRVQLAGQSLPRPYSEGRRAERLQRALFGSGAHRIPGPLGVSTSADGCLSEARQRLYGSVRDYLDVIWFVNEVRHYQQGWTGDPKPRPLLATISDACLRRDINSPHSARCFG